MSETAVALIAAGGAIVLFFLYENQQQQQQVQNALLLKIANTPTVAPAAAANPLSFLGPVASLFAAIL